MSGRQPARVRAISHWWTTGEWGFDSRSGAVAKLTERPRCPSDRPGKHRDVWEWKVFVERQRVDSGVAQSQSGARAAVRKVIRALPDKDKEQA